MMTDVLLCLEDINMVVHENVIQYNERKVLQNTVKSASFVTNKPHMSSIFL